jgi:tetratricopeptide (TPR) repeat protein
MLLFAFPPAFADAESSGTNINQPAPRGALAWFRQGVELARGGDYNAALARFKQAISLSPNWALPYVEIAVAHMKTDNDHELISDALSKAVRLGDNMPRAHYLYGVFLQEDGKRREAIRELTRALTLRPSMAKARFRLATLYIEDGRQSDGVHQFELLVKQKPSHIGARRNLAVLYEQSGRLEEAESQLIAITKLFPLNAYHMSSLARFYKRTGWSQKAKAAFQKAERLDSTRDKRRLRPLLKSKDPGVSHYNR